MWFITVKILPQLDDQSYWLGFSLIPGIGLKRLLRLLNYFGDLRSAWVAQEVDLHRAGLEESIIVVLRQTRAQINLDAEMAKIEKAGAWLLTFNDNDYPTTLKAIDDAPAVLYIRGVLTPTDDLALSVVGTRKATQYGRDVAHDLSKRLAQQGITIISGLAQGIDSAAHLGALAGGGRTIAILGCGVDVIYPRENRELAQKIIADGALVSEFPIGTQPISSNFPRRNRIVSGMALGVLVIEAPEGSGALITAELAAEQGREVFAVPGNILNPMSRGTNRLIQDGAKLVMQAEDILNELSVAYTNTQTREKTEQIIPANATEAAILNVLNADPIHIDDIARLCSLSIPELSSTLTILELKGLAQMVGHMQYSLTFGH
ncbi:MAG: DNA-protecting protein DprA [Chitinophagaceae bacterium]|nr:DNA-protecting protein DprA [Anaerolineae bacterium]